MELPDLNFGKVVSTLFCKAQALVQPHLPILRHDFKSEDKIDSDRVAGNVVKYFAFEIVWAIAIAVIVLIFRVSVMSFLQPAGSLPRLQM